MGLVASEVLARAHQGDVACLMLSVIGPPELSVIPAATRLSMRQHGCSG